MIRSYILRACLLFQFCCDSCLAAETVTPSYLLCKPIAKKTGIRWFLANPIFSSATKELVTCGQDGKVHFWDVDTGDLKATISVSTAAIVGLIPPKSKDLVVVSNDGKYSRWDLATHKKSDSREFFVPQPSVSSIFTIEANSILVVQDKEVLYFDLDVSKPYHYESNYSLHRAFRISKSRILCSYADFERRPCVIDVSNSKQLFSLELEGDLEILDAIQLSDERSLALACGDGSLKIYDLDGKQIVKSFKTKQRSLIHLALSSDGKSLYALGTNSSIEKFNLETRQHVLSISLPKECCTINRFAINKDQSLLAVIAEHGQVCLLRLKEKPKKNP